MAIAFFSFGKGLEYYTTLRKVIDAIVGFVVGWMGFGFALWWLLPSPLVCTALALVVLAAALLPMRYGRRWLGGAILVGMVCTSLFFGFLNGYL